MNDGEITAVILTALLGSGGVIGLLFWAVKQGLEGLGQKRAARETARLEEARKRDETRERIGYLVRHGEEVDRRIQDMAEAVDRQMQDMAEENTLQCYCLLACLRGLAEQGCNGPVHDGIIRLEKYLNKKAHGDIP